MMTGFLGLWNKRLFFQWGSLKIFPIGPLAGLAALIFIFGAWKKLKDDYGDDDIVVFSLGGFWVWLIFSRLGFLVLNNGFSEKPVNWFSFWNYSGFDFWTGMLSFFIFAILFCKRYDWIFWDAIEKLTPVSIFSFLVVAFGNFLSYPRFVSAAATLPVLLVFILGFYLKRYRSFSWYGSGRVGFLPLSSLAFFSLFDIVYRFVFSGIGRNIFIDATVAFLSLLGIYLLSGRRVDIL